MKIKCFYPQGEDCERFGTIEKALREINNDGGTVFVHFLPDFSILKDKKYGIKEEARPESNRIVIVTRVKNGFCVYFKYDKIKEIGKKVEFVKREVVRPINKFNRHKRFGN